MSGVGLALLVFGIFFILLFLKMPVALAMAISGFIGLVINSGLTPAFEIVGKEIYTQFSSYTMGVVPMFVWMGYIAYYAGIGKGLFNFFDKLVGHRHGGLLYASTLANAMFGAICGSPTAAVATMGNICFPEMKRYGYDEGFSAANIGASATLSVLIPPSLTLIVYGVQTEESIGQLFMGGVFPGILLMIAYCVAIFIVAKVSPQKCPAGTRVPWKERLKASLGTIDVIIIFIICLGGLFAGFFTPTEAGAVGAAAVLVASLIKRKLSWKDFCLSIKDTVKTTAMVMFLIFGAQIIGRLLTLTGLANAFVGWLGGLAVPRILILGMVLLLCVFLGFFIDALSLTLIAVPVFYPLIVNTLGFNGILFGVLWTLVGGIGALTPPVGFQVFVASNVCKLPTGKVFKGVWPFFYAAVATLIILVLIPEITTFLPNLLY